MALQKTKHTLVESPYDITDKYPIYCIDFGKDKFIDYDELILLPFCKIMELIDLKKLYKAYYKEKEKTKVIKSKTQVVKEESTIFNAKKTLKDIYK